MVISVDFKKIMDSASPLWGICPFGRLSSKLLPCRAKSRIPENAKSVIVCCFPYLLVEEEYKNSNVSKYAVVTDYHEVALSRLNRACNELKNLFPSEEFAAFADNSAIPEVEAACIAGLGKRGKNSLLITEKYGSYVFIGEIVTTLEIPCTENAISSCIQCGKCIRSCPSGALSESGFKKEKCLSEITQKKGELSAEETALLKACGCAWGCDVCQDVCPMNKNAGKTEIAEFLNSAHPVVTEDTPLENRAYEWRGKKVIDRNINILKGE